MTIAEWSQAVGIAVPLGLLVGLVIAWTNSWRV